MSTISGSDIKRELIKLRLKEGEREALLSGFVRVCMSVSLSLRKGLMLGLDCQTDFVREYITSLMMKEFMISPKSDEAEWKYADCEKLLRQLNILDPDSAEYEFVGIAARFEEYCSAYVRGMFLGCGSFSAHDNADEENQKGGVGYHLEFSFMNEDIADGLRDMLARHGIVMRKMLRDEKHVVYAKDGKTVCDCLTLMRLGKLVAKFNGCEVTLSLKRDVNRRTNCEIANLSRTTTASVDVCDAIETIDGTIGLDALPPKLLEAAEARLNSPVMPLGDLAYELNISKSGLKHRFDRLIAIARDIADDGTYNGKKYDKTKRRG